MRMKRRGRVAGWIVSALTVLPVLSGCAESTADAPGPEARENTTRKLGAYPAAFAGLVQWDDGLSEISYYDAVDTIYGAQRRYTRVMLVNREWLNAAEFVKAMVPDLARGDIPVLKLNIAEEIPTANYNYRYMVTLFVNRESLLPLKLTASSQEWCGTTFKQLQWLPAGRGTEAPSRPELRIQSFSYFEGEGDRVWALPGEPVVYPAEALFLLVRASAAAGRDWDLHLLPPMRSNHAVAPTPVAAQIRVDRAVSELDVPFGKFRAVRVRVSRESHEERFWIESDPPYRLLSHESDAGQQMILRHVERRAYWDPSSGSSFYRPGTAP